jgi:hypothetical protein
MFDFTCASHHRTPIWRRSLERSLDRAMPVFTEAIAGDAGGTIAFSIAKRGIPNA